jgi:hypothetical protein
MIQENTAIARSPGALIESDHCALLIRDFLPTRDIESSLTGTTSSLTIFIILIIDRDQCEFLPICQEGNSNSTYYSLNCADILLSEECTVRTVPLVNPGIQWCRLSRPATPKTCSVWCLDTLMCHARYWPLNFDSLQYCNTTIKVRRQLSGYKSRTTRPRLTGRSRGR